jgi:hypothetical protein
MRMNLHSPNQLLTKKRSLFLLMEHATSAVRRRKLRLSYGGCYQAVGSRRLIPAHSGFRTTT